MHRIGKACETSGFGSMYGPAAVSKRNFAGYLDEKQVASLAGLAPRTGQSGQWRGKASIRGGCSAIRQALCMPMMVAT